MLVKELIQRVQNQDVKNTLKDLPVRKIYSTLLSIRALLYSQKLNKKQKIDPTSYPTLLKVELSKSRQDTLNFNIPGKNYLYKSVVPLPKTISSLYSTTNILAVNTIAENPLTGVTINFAESTEESVRYKKGAKYTSLKPCYFIKDNHLYVWGKTTPKYVNVKALYYSPYQVFTFNLPTGESLSPLDFDLPVDESVKENLIQLTKEALQGQINLTQSQNEKSKG